MTVLSSYFGGDLSEQEYWMLELVRIHESHRLDEPELLNSRWFDYRRFPPAKLTYLFAAMYARQYVFSYRCVFDIRTADEIVPFAPEDIFQSKDLIPMWRARQEADRLGIKYSFFLNFAFTRFADRGWKNLPRPNQLYGEELLLDIRDAWDRRCGEVMQLAHDPFFFEKSYVAHPDQDRYYAYVVGQISARQHKHLALATVLKEGILPREIAGREFGADVLKRAINFMASC